jgi:hypothetical protein
MVIKITSILLTLLLWIGHGMEEVWLPYRQLAAEKHRQALNL